MKKFILLLVSLICLICLSACTQGEKTSEPGIVVEKITYEQHDWLIFSTTNGRYIGVDHDPNCWCMIDYD